MLNHIASGLTKKKAFYSSYALCSPPRPRPPHHEEEHETIALQRVQWQAVKPRLEEIFRKGGKQATATASREYGYRLREIAEFLGVHYATVSRRLQELEGAKKRIV